MMDDFDQDLAADAWSGGEHAAVIDEPADLDEPIAAGPETSSEISEEPSPIRSDDGEASDTVLDDIPDLTDPDPQPPTSGDPAVDATAPGIDDDGVHGSPVAWTLNWFYQQVDGYCGPSAVAQVVAQYTGASITDPGQLVDRAVELGLMGDPAEGMSLPNIEALLEDQGVPATLTDGSLDDLRERLDNGYGVIAMVDSGEIWHPDQERGEDDTADHVLVVAGIDDKRGVVILSDPGVPSGNQLEVPIEQFEDAWADSGHQMLVTDAPDDGLIDQPNAAAVPVDRSAIIRLG
ncbi:putative double-glycine peptidase [Rhodococcus sp. PvR044]|uniref:C39 family peptidase n=1 Tax=Rhodococcus sp. PvR044 TaxID=3156402 RepID=UPI0033920255